MFVVNQYCGKYAFVVMSLTAPAEALQGRDLMFRGANSLLLFAANT
jgi:hypothetical protein